MDSKKKVSEKKDVCGACDFIAGMSDPSPCVKKKKPVNQWDTACERFVQATGRELTEAEEVIADKVWDRIYKGEE
jgi:hypothetical protein